MKLLPIPRIKSVLSATLLTIFLISFSALPSFAQLENSGKFIRAGVEDAELLLSEYFKPFGKGFGPGLNAEWVHSAKPHKTLGFHLSVRAGLAIVPEADKSFDVTNLNFNRLEYADDPGDSPITPTINGENTKGPRMLAQTMVTLPDGSTQQVTLADFNMPQGTGFGYVPAPMIQGGVGIIKDTEVMIRYMPPVDMGFDGSINLIGGGIKHGLNQWLPGGGLLPVDISIMAGYTSLGVDVNLDVQPEVDSNTRNPYANQPDTWEGQKITMNSQSFTAMALVGKNLPIISVYGGIGIESSTLDLNMNGSYPVTAPDDPNNPNYEAGKYKVVKKVDNPIALSFKGANSLKAMAGVRFRVAIFSINADYTIGNYPVASVGVGISFR